MDFAKIILLSLYCCFLAEICFAKEKDKKEASIPYLGPGFENLSQADYEKLYKSYIQMSVLLGYTFSSEPKAACDQALDGIFRQVGMFAYPVPKDAGQVIRTTKILGGKKVETYEFGGITAQLVRKPGGPLDRLFLVTSSSPRASRKLSQVVRNQILELTKDPVTNLEKVTGIPVGFPHPLLLNDSQGLYVRMLKFEASDQSCVPIAYVDNSWVGGFSLSDSRCAELQGDVQEVWKEKMTSQQFVEKELARMREKVQAEAISKGKKPEEIKAMLDSTFVAPLTNSLNVIGAAMRGMAQCNFLAMGKGEKKKTEKSGITTGPTDSDSAK